MNWPDSFDQRLRGWSDLRRDVVDLDTVPCLLKINDWWQLSPWQPYYLHWDDCKHWPGPWDLLADNVFCGLARALGMLYTVMLVGREHHTIELVETDCGNLVLIDQGKYILNWEPDQILNIASPALAITRRIDSHELTHLLGNT